jgi:hypothetical protein
VQISASDFQAIERIAVGDNVLTAGKSLKWETKTVVFSQGTTGASRQKYTVLVTYEDTALAVTSDHLFLLYGGNLITADRLTVKDQLVAPDGNPVKIKSVHIGDYTAGFHHIATSKTLEDPVELTGHLLNTNGVVSGDYALQLLYRHDDMRTSFVASHDTLPVVGSPEYVSIHGDDCLQAPSEPTAPIRIALNNAVSPKEERLTRREGTFVPSIATIVPIPPDACSFISDAEAKQKAMDPKRAFNDPLSREWSEYLVEHHRNFYPNVSYHIDWADNTVNAFAWVDAGTGIRHVALKGGLIRHSALELEGIALVLAHELAHHFGGSPTFPEGLSCEGQSDYFGVRNVMRRVWFGDQYINTTDKAIAQMANFFGVPNSPNVPGGTSNCSHPAGACRIATYHRAVNLGGKPNCAV